MRAVMCQLAGGLAVLLLLSGSAEAVVLDPTLDAYLEDFDSSGTLDGVADDIRNTNALLSGAGLLSSGAAIDSRSIIVFDISPFAGLTLSSASLSGFGGGVDHNYAPATIDGKFFVAAGDGTVTLSDFDSSATSLGSLTFQGLDSTVLFPSLFPFELATTQQLQDLLDAGATYAEFRIQSDELTVFVNAAEAESPFQPDTRFAGPKLTLNFEEPGGGAPVVPEPSSLVLVGTGVLGLAGAKRRGRWANRLRAERGA